MLSRVQSPMRDSYKIVRYQVGRSVYNDTKVLKHIDVALRTNGTANGTTVDRLANGGNYRSMEFVVFSGTMTDGTVAVTLADSDDGVSFNTANAADVQGTNPVSVASTDDNIIAEIGYTGSKRYVRLQAVSSGTTTGGIFGAIVILGGPRRYPV